MNATLIPSTVISLFVIFVILGFISGWFRGLSKSLTRLIIVLAVGVLAFFVVPSLTETLMNLDISKMNITIGNIQATTPQELITDLLRQIPIIEDIVESSPTFETLIEIFPLLLCNVVLFVLFFFLFKWFSLIIYWIIGAIFFSKKKMKGKEKHNFIGALIGALQGVLVAFVLLIPVFGIVETIKPIGRAVDAQNQTSVEQTVAANSQEKTADDMIVKAVSEITEYTVEFESNWVTKLFKFVGLKNLSVSMFEKLTTVETPEVKVSVLDETEALANAYPYIKPLLNEGLNIKDNEQLEDLNLGINELFESEVLSNIIGEIVPEAANRWSTGAKFCEISKPEFDDEATQELFDALLKNLATADKTQIKNDIDVIFGILIISNDAEILQTLTSGGDILNVLGSSNNDSYIVEVISKALESRTLKAVLPDVVNVGMNFVYDALDIDKSKIDKITKTSDEINWDSETVELQTIVTNVVDIVEQIEDGEAVGKTPLESLDFGLLGSTFDSIRRSELLGPSSLEIMKAILNSPSIVGESSATLQNFVSELEVVWVGTEPLTDTFIVLGKTLKLAKDMQTNTEDFNVDDLGSILEDLATNDTLKDVVTEVVNKETLEDLGLDAETAGVVNETISTIIGADYSDGSGNDLAKEIEAAKEIYGVANKVINLDKTDENAKAEVSEEESKVLVEKLAQSTVLLDTIYEAINQEDSGVGSLEIAKNLDQTSQDHLKNQIDSLSTESEALQGKTQEEIDELKNKLNALFGLMNSSEE